MKKEKKFFSTIFGAKKQMNILDIPSNQFSVCQKVKLLLPLVAAGLAPATAVVGVMDHALPRARVVVKKEGK